jgi:hypothetical protein
VIAASEPLSEIRAMQRQMLSPIPQRQKPPFHERFRLLGYLRGRTRAALFRFLRKLADTDDARTIQVSSLRNLLPSRPNVSDLDLSGVPYPGLGLPSPTSNVSQRDDVLFITARFRSGSTLLWNLFRQINDCTAYYEPFNERRWFDAAARGDRIDPTHRGVDDYWREYSGLGELGRYYQAEWAHRNLYMDAHSWNPGMKRYVQLLIERAAGRPVLQFNRIDFRLAWFRHHFPNAKLIHLYRHPRDQWISSLVDFQAVPRSVSIADFHSYDHYYLLSWATDLKYFFPFLDQASASHPYELFYFIWKLSFLFGKAYSHFSLAFEDVTANPKARLDELFEACGILNPPLQQLVGLIEKPQSGRWRQYASEEWFQDCEARCDAVIADFLRP